MEIIKVTGEAEQFKDQKLYQSLLKSGASREIADRIKTQVEDEVKAGMTTDQIFQKVFRYLKKEDICAAARYRLKRGIMELGPAGFLFEQYFSAILQEYGYGTRLNQMVRGECVTHEIDIVADKDTSRYFVEAKYHNSHGVKTDTKTVMYAYARLLDIIPAEQRRGYSTPIEYYGMWLVTNTKFTNRAKRYARCRGITITGWGYPKKNSLQYLIEEKLLHPITVIPSVDRFSRERFAENKILFAKDLVGYDADRLVYAFGLLPSKARQIAREVKALLKN
ncbi:MAG: restriction endonuclease [bacterium]